MPASLQGTSGTSGMPRFHNMRTRALSDEYGRHARPASAGVSCMLGSLQREDSGVVSLTPTC